MTALVRLIQARKASKQKIMQKPTLVAILDWQLHDLKKAEAAVEVQKNANPVKHDPKSEEINPVPRKGIESAAPIAAYLLAAIFSPERYGGASLETMNVVIVEWDRKRRLMSRLFNRTPRASL
jgi:hypothetical protein